MNFSDDFVPDAEHVLQTSLQERPHKFTCSLLLFKSRFEKTEPLLDSESSVLMWINGITNHKHRSRWCFKVTHFIIENFFLYVLNYFSINFNVRKKKSIFKKIEKKEKKIIQDLSKDYLIICRW